MSVDARGAQSGADVQQYFVVTFDVGGAAARAVGPVDEVDVVCVVAAVVNVAVAAADVVEVVLEAVADTLWAADDD